MREGGVPRGLRRPQRWVTERAEARGQGACSDPESAGGARPRGSQPPTRRGPCLPGRSCPERARRRRGELVELRVTPHLPSSGCRRRCRPQPFIQPSTATDEPTSSAIVAIGQASAKSVSTRSSGGVVERGRRGRDDVGVRRVQRLHQLAVEVATALDHGHAELLLAAGEEVVERPYGASAAASTALTPVPRSRAGRTARPPPRPTAPGSPADSVGSLTRPRARSYSNH